MTNNSTSQSSSEGWYKNMLSESDAKVLEHSGKMVLLFEILKMAENFDDKVYVIVCYNKQCSHLPHINDFLKLTN